MTNQEILNQIHRGVIVSCQALPDEPLYGYHFMGHLAFAAKEGGAVGIRANTCEDIVDIKKEVDLPVIGIIKSVYDDSDVSITPTMKEIEELQRQRDRLTQMSHDKAKWSSGTERNGGRGDTSEMKHRISMLLERSKAVTKKES